MLMLLSTMDIASLEYSSRLHTQDPVSLLCPLLLC